MSLTTFHPLWQLAKSPFEVVKTSTVACMLSGPFVTDLCQLCLMGKHPFSLGTFIECPAMLNVRKTSSSHWSNYLQAKLELLLIPSCYALKAINEYSFSPLSLISIFFSKMVQFSQRKRYTLLIIFFLHNL